MVCSLWSFDHTLPHLVPHITQIPSVCKSSPPGVPPISLSLSRHRPVTAPFLLWPTLWNHPKVLQAGQPLLGLSTGNTAQVRLISAASRGAFLFLRVRLLWSCPLFFHPPDPTCLLTRLRAARFSLYPSLNIHAISWICIYNPWISASFTLVCVLMLFLYTVGVVFV